MQSNNVPDENENGLDDMGPSTHESHDATHFRRIIAAQKGLKAAEQELRDAVTAAREAGDSWTAIGAAMGTTRQGAYKRFGKVLKDPPKEMRKYAYSHPNNDPSLYENQPAMHDKATCTVWALHMHIHPSGLEAILDRMARMPEVTGEYTYGDSWTEWGEKTDDDTDRHLVIYFKAEPDEAASIGHHLANHATIAAVQAAGADGGDIPPYAISTSGDYAEQLND